MSDTEPRRLDLTVRFEMAITGGFGMTLDLERGTMRRWVMGSDSVKRWADNNQPVYGHTPRDVLQGVIDAANAFDHEPHPELRIVTLRMDEALRILADLTPSAELRGAGHEK